MEQVGPRLRARALELQLSDAEVARRSGLTSTRYGHYVSGYREPDLATLVRVCRVLGLRPDELLGYDSASGTPDELQERRRRVVAYVEVMDAETLDLAIPVMQALAATPGLRGTLARLAEAADSTGGGKARRRPTHEG